MTNKNQQPTQTKQTKQVTKPTRYSKHFTVTIGIKADSVLDTMDSMT